MATQDDRTEANVPSEEFPCLEILSGPTGVKRRYPLRVGKNYVGRLSENDVVLDDTSVSRRHVMVEVKGNEATVADQGSRNGTKIGGNLLKPDEAYPLAHNTEIRVGSYRLRYLTRGEGTVIEEEPVREPSPPEPEQIPEEEPQEEPQKEELRDRPRPESFRRFLRPVLIGLLGILFVVIVFEAAQFFLKPKKDRVERKKPGVVEEQIQGEVGEVLSPSEDETEPVSSPVRPVFLEFSSDPVRAKVFFGQEEIGETPFRVSTRLEEGKEYEVRALFQLPEVDQVVEEKLRLRLTPGVEVVPIAFRPKVGVLKISYLPRNIQLYLEGYFETDPYRPRPVKFAEIVFGKPIYTPHGRYILELRESRQLEGSQTFVDQVVYRREFFLKPDSSGYTVEVREEDLKFFPVQISSIPSGARVFIDDKEVGVCPYAGSFPIGEHRLLLRQEGFFDFSQLVKMEINTPFVAEITMKTSEAGEMINKASELIRSNRHTEAQSMLIEAYKKNPSARESAEISYLIGVCYLWQKSYAEAEGYFNRAMEHPQLKLQGRLGLASAAYHQGNPVKALQLLVDVLVSGEDPVVRSDAGTLFQQISPLKSVIYITSDPLGAIVFVNGKEISQVTPIILHDLSVGAYRVEVKKGGFQPAEVKLNLGVAEFRPVVVKLNPVE